MENNKTYTVPKGAKSLNELYDKDRYFCWVNAAGDVNLPEDGNKLISHEFEDLPVNIQELSQLFWTENLAATVHVVTLNGEPGITLDFGWYFSADFLERIPVPDDKLDAHIKACGIKFAEMMATNAPAGVIIYYGDGTDPDGDEIVAFIPEHLCSSLLGPDCKDADALVDRAWKLANEILGVSRKYQFRKDIETTIPTWALVEDIQQLRKALNEAHFSSYMSIRNLMDQVNTTIECLEGSIANQTKVPDGLAITPSGTSLIAPNVEEGIIIQNNGEDIPCAAGKPVSLATAGGVCQCDENCPYFKDCFTEDGTPIHGIIMPMQMKHASNVSGQDIVSYLEKNR